MGWTAEAGGMAYCHATTRYLHTITRGTHTLTHIRIEIFFTNLRTKLIYHRKGRKTKKKTLLCLVSFSFSSCSALLPLLPFGFSG